jgi:hypothetical protein
MKSGIPRITRHAVFLCALTDATLLIPDSTALHPGYGIFLYSPNFPSVLPHVTVER